MIGLGQWKSEWRMTSKRNPYTQGLKLETNRLSHRSL